MVCVIGRTKLTTDNVQVDPRKQISLKQLESSVSLFEPSEDWSVWHTALDEAATDENRDAWSKAGRDAISKMGLRPEDQALKLLEIISDLRD